MQPIRLQGFQPFPVCLGPFTFGGRIVEAMAQTESGNLLFNPLKGQLVIITHPDEFLYLFLLRGRDMNRVVGMESQTFRDKHGIPFIGFDFADTEDSAHSGRSKDDAPYLVSSQLVVEAVTEMCIRDRKIIALFLIMGMGILLVKCRILKESDSRVISALSIHLIVPCVILAAFQVDFTEEIGKGLLLALAAAVIINVGLILFVSAVGKIFHMDAVENVSIIYSLSLIHI